MDSSILCEVMDFKSAHEIWVFLNEKYGAISNDDEPKEEAHEDVKHDHNKVVVEDCSTSRSNDDKDDHTTRSLDKKNDNATSDASNDSTSCTLDSEDDGYESDASTSSSTSSHGNTKIHVGGFVVDCDDPNLELLYKLSRALKREMEKASKLKNENLFSKDHM
jgi:hypothetical protein